LAWFRPTVRLTDRQKEREDLGVPRQGTAAVYHMEATSAKSPRDASTNN
jgi:hypothetical protein